MEWLEYLKLKNLDLTQLQSNPDDPPILFHSNDQNSLPREISLRINAIRETFEEMGILLCRREDQLDSNAFHHSKSIDIPYWQARIHNKKTTFLDFCKKFNLIPQLNSIHKWNCWLTPTEHARRFATATFFIQLDDFPPIYPEAKEVQDFQWLSPEDIFSQHREGKIWIPPPVIIEIQIFPMFHKLSCVMEFLEERKGKGLKLNFPVQFHLNDGIIIVFPGDDLYPQSPNYHKIDHNPDAFCELSMEEINAKCKNVFRFQFIDMMNIKLVIKSEKRGKL